MAPHFSLSLIHASIMKKVKNLKLHIHKMYLDFLLQYIIKYLLTDYEFLKNHLRWLSLY